MLVKGVPVLVASFPTSNALVLISTHNDLYKTCRFVQIRKCDVKLEWRLATQSQSYGMRRDFQLAGITDCVTG